MEEVTIGLMTHTGADRSGVAWRWAESNRRTQMFRMRLSSGANQCTP
jgi:hypothetical protein